ncbi:hypothetical protein BH09BAC1_BH09BAC1_26310 [soil metagenome]
MQTTPTTYSLSVYMVKVTVNGSNQPVLQVVTRNNDTVMSTLNLSSQGAEITTVDTDFYIVGSVATEEEYVNYIDPTNNDIYLTTNGRLEYINGSTIYLEVYNAYLKYEDGYVNFYEAEKQQQQLRKAS